jgi:hypothetical protein
MSGLFKSKTEKHTPEVSVVADPYAPTREALQNWITENLGEGKQYEGDIISKDPTQYEQASFGKLSEYAGSQLPSIWRSGQEELQKTLSGDYDPSSSPYYQAVKAEAARNLEDTQKNIASKAGGAGRYYSGARIKQQGEAATDTGIAMNKMLGEMAEQERVRRLQAAPVAMQAGQYEQQLPLQQATALQGLGALPRQLQDAYQQAMYNEWMQATRQWPLSVAGIAGGVQQAPLYAQAGYTQSPSPFSQIFNPIAGAVGQGLGTALGMGAGNYFFPTNAAQAGAGRVTG